MKSERTEPYSSNMFEYDWCVSASHYAKHELLQLENAHILLGGNVDPLIGAICRFFHFADQKYDLQLSITLAVPAQEVQDAEKNYTFARIVNIDEINLPIPADFCIYSCYDTLWQETEIPYTDADIKRLERFWNDLACPVQRAVCISDCRIYDVYPYPYVISEMECSNTGNNLAQIAEQLLQQTGYSFILMRSGIILGAELGIQSPISRFLDQLMSTENTGEIVERTQYPVIYITDFLTALVTLMTTPYANCAYNVCSKESTVSLAHICSICYGICDEFPLFHLTFSDTKKSRNYAMSSAKLKKLGWQPAVSLKMMLELELMARKDNEAYIFNDMHEGKLPALQDALLGMLCEFDRICKKYHIQYFLGGGTLLGAVRHEGFIPWDDDLDVMMLRDDYEWFLQVAKSELPDHLFLQTPGNERGDHYLIAKIRLEGTIFSSEFLSRFPDLHNGVFLDIIAQDYTANSRIGQKLHTKLTLLARGLVFKKWSGESAAKLKHKKWYIIFDIIAKVTPFFVLEWFQKKVLTLFCRGKNKRYLFDGMGPNITRGAYPAAWLQHSIPMKFEGIEFPVPVDYEKYLHYLYGDYRQPVTISQRYESHHVQQVDLGIYGAYYNMKEKLENKDCWRNETNTYRR